MSAKHTPGPWELRTVSAKEKAWEAIEGQGGVTVCARATWLPMSVEESLANGQLLRAAPDLADALEECADIMEQQYRVALSGRKAEKDKAVEEHVVLRRARAALKKAGRLK